MKKILLLLLVFGSAHLYAQSPGGILTGDTISEDPSYSVIYRNIADTTISVDGSSQPVEYRFDLDSDGIQDFSAYLYCLHVMGGGNTSCTLRPLNSKGRIAVYADSCHGLTPVERLDSNAAIDAARVWQNNEAPLYRWAWSWTPYSDWKCGTWLGQTSKFAGLSLIGATDTLFGWIRMSVLDEACVTLTVHDFAVKKRNPLGHSEKNGPSVVVSPNPTDGNCRLTLSRPAILVQILSSRGQILREYLQVRRELRVDITGFPAGIYFVVVRDERGSSAHKLVLQ